MKTSYGIHHYDTAVASQEYLCNPQKLFILGGAEGFITSTFHVK